jgi:hypothetical protein
VKYAKVEPAPLRRWDGEIGQTRSNCLVLEVELTGGAGIVYPESWRYPTVTDEAGNEYYRVTVTGCTVGIPAEGELRPGETKSHVCAFVRPLESAKTLTIRFGDVRASFPAP